MLHLPFEHGGESLRLDEHQAEHVLRDRVSIPCGLDTTEQRILDFTIDRFAHADRDADATLDELVEHFARLRAENLARLGELATDADLDRRGMHPSLGEVTLRELLSTWAVHDLDHVSQIFAGMAGSHDAEVGPWKAYLGILLRREDPSAVAG